MSIEHQIYLDSAPTTGPPVAARLLTIEPPPRCCTSSEMLTLHRQAVRLVSYALLYVPA
ncbi:hypothetical protein BC832DRAFT_562757 [Gaertneriomyces semiglobifer]|nr:hypothetical protein BC832DRAFT_562757 [Gaertneriomyces semiglobifer]